MVGQNPIMYLEPLAEAIKSAEPEINLAIAGLTEPTGRDVMEERSGVFDHYYPELNPIRQDPDVDAKNWLARIWKRGKARILRRAAIREVATDFAKIRERVDLINVQGLFLNPIHRWLLHERELPYVVTCWGSDVLRTTKARTIAVQQRLLQGAGSVTVSTPELKESLLAKYGRALAPKVCQAFFFPPGVHSAGRAARPPARDSFRRRHQVDEDKIVVCVGHNGNPGGQHRELLESLRREGKAHREKLFVVLPMTYGGDPKYRSSVREVFEALGCEGVILEQYMSAEEIEELRLATDIFIYAPVSDAFSASVSEALAAGNVVLLGSWLPYNLRRRAGFRYWEFDTPESAGEVLVDVLNRWPKPARETESNRELSISFFTREKVGRGWTRAYQQALEAHRSAGLGC